MGAGRKTHAYPLKEKSQPPWTVNCSTTARNLRKSDLGGVIFGCKHNTINECYFKQLFGLPAPHISYVRNIDPGLPLFLFNYSDRKLHGIFEAASPGQLNINQYGWTDGSVYTPYAAQVRIRIRMQCQPLLEDQFSPIISENYYEPRLFWFELDRAQANKLISLFSSSPVMSSTSLPKNTEKWSNLFKASVAPNARQELENMETSNLEVEVASANHANMEWGSSWDDPGLGRESQNLEAVIGDEEAKNDEQEVIHMKPSFGRSFCSVVKDMNVPVAHSDHSNIKHGSWDNHDLGGESQMLEASTTGEAAENHEEVVHQNLYVDRSYSSVVKSSSTSFSEKKWTALFRDTNPSDSRKEIEDFKTPASEVDPFHFNIEWELSCVAPYSHGSGQLLEAPADEEGLEKYHKELVSKVPCSSVVAETSAYFPQSTPYETLPAADSRRRGDDFKAAAAERNLPYSDKNNMKWNSSVSPCLDMESQPLEASIGEAALELHKGEHVHFKSNCERSSFPAATGEMISGNNPRVDTERHLRDLSFSRAAMVSDMKSSGLQSVVAKLLLEVEELTFSQLKQVQKISSLEQELVESRIEIQELKDWRKTLEYRSFPAIGHVEAEEIESPNESHSYHDESILIVGGFDGRSWLSTVDIYYPFQDLMKSLRPMSYIRSYTSAAKFNGELYVFGGVNGSLWYNTVESYNLVSNQWVSRPPLNQRKSSLAGVSLNDKIFAIGGGNGIESFSEVEMLDLDVGRWIPSRSMLNKRFAPAAAEINGTIYVVGGFNGKDYLKSIERFDPREHSWTSLESMTTKRACHSLAVLNEKLYAVGGYDGARMVPTVEVFDPRVGSWMMGESMNDPRGYSGAFVIGDAVYVIGGLNDNNEILGTVECYKDGHGWQITDLKAIGRRCFFSAIVI